MSIPIEWLRALSGGVLIGTSAALLLALNGRIAGVSGIVGEATAAPVAAASAWRWLFLLGLALGGGLSMRLLPGAFHAPPMGALGVPGVLIAGALVGAGTRLGNGCTSGHGVCGISRGSLRSIAATLTFIATGALTVLATRGLR
ncbi:MAG: YeeE/YedE family protein [Myxococcales bacterium]|nr:YeeE/YedE family protein [Myxococcales bacterium]